MGRVFNLLVRWFALPGIHDTQCGFKCFSRHAARTVFPLQQIDGWGFDVEVLYIARRHGIPIVEVPVDWYYGEDSRVRPAQDTVNMVTDLVKIRRNGRAGVYNPPAAADGRAVNRLATGGRKWMRAERAWPARSAPCLSRSGRRAEPERCP